MSDLVKSLVEMGDLVKSLREQVDKLEVIKCPDNLGGLHRWNGDGQCLDCSNYATDLNDKALRGSK